MGFFKEFKEFAMKGNVMDMAIGVIIGGAFGKIVTSLVNDILMPLIGALIGNVDFTTLSVTLREAVMEGDETGALTEYNRHSKSLAASSAWKTASVPVSSLAQDKGWGTTVALKMATVVQLPTMSRATLLFTSLSTSLCCRTVCLRVKHSISS